MTYFNIGMLSKEYDAREVTEVKYFSTFRLTITGLYLNTVPRAFLTPLGTAFRGNTLITRFFEFAHFGATTLAENSFRDATALEYIKLPSTLLTAAGYVFFNCPLFHGDDNNAIVFPDGFQKGSSSNMYLTGTTTNVDVIVVPETCTTLGGNRFINSNNIKALILKRGEVEGQYTGYQYSGTIYQYSSSFRVYVPDSAVSTYKSSLSARASLFYGFSQLAIDHPEYYERYIESD